MTIYLNPNAPAPLDAAEGSLGEFNPYLKPTITDPSEIYRAESLRLPNGEPLYVPTSNKRAVWLATKPMYMLWPETTGFVNIGSFMHGTKATAITPPPITGNQFNITVTNNILQANVPTRTNLSLRPWFQEGANAGFGGLNNATQAVKGENALYGTRSLKVECVGTSVNQEGIQRTGSRPSVVEGKTYTWTIFLRGTPGKKAKAQIVWRNAEGTVVGASASGVSGTLTESYQAFTVTAVAPATATLADTRAIANAIGTTEGAFIFWVGAHMLEESATQGTFFPTPEQLAEGVAGYSGEGEGKSVADLGPFARGTADTFVVGANPASLATNAGLLGLTPNAPIWLSLSGTMTARLAGTDVALSGSGKAVAGQHQYAMTFNDATNAIKGYIDGVAQTGTATTTATWTPPPTFEIGQALGITNRFPTGPVGIWPRELTAAEVASLV